MEATNVEKIYVKDHENKYASKATAGTALGLSIGALGWMLLSGKGLPGLTNNLGGYSDANGCNPCAGPTAWQAWQKECSDQMAAQEQRFGDRQVIDREMFGLYKSQIDADFNLYKGQRDNYDTLYNKIAALETQVAVTNAVRPYQDKIINLSIEDSRKDARYDLSHAMCRVIKGEVVLPNLPTVTGFPSYRRCGGFDEAPAA